MRWTSKRPSLEATPLEAPVTQAAAHNNFVVSVYPDRLELRSGWQGQNVDSMNLKEVSTVAVRGLVNCTLTIQTNTGRVYELTRMALPDARGVKTAVEAQKRRAGLYE
jgi:hypothetical protein